MGECSIQRRRQSNANKALGVQFTRCCFFAFASPLYFIVNLTSRTEKKTTTTATKYIKLSTPEHTKQNQKKK